MNANLKKTVIAAALFLFVSIALSSAYDDDGGYSRVILGEIQGREWKLIEVKKGFPVIAAIDRTNIPGNIYTIKCCTLPRKETMIFR